MLDISILKQKKNSTAKNRIEAVERKNNSMLRKSIQSRKYETWLTFESIKKDTNHG